MYSAQDDIRLAQMQGYGREALSEALDLTDEELRQITGNAAERLIALCQDLQEIGDDSYAG